MPLADVDPALLFGPHAQGRAQPHSDIDVAVILTPAAARGPRLACLRRIIEALAHEMAATKLDIVVRNEAPTLLADEVLRTGVLVTCRNEAALRDFKVHAYRGHGDRAAAERFFREQVK